MKAVVLDVPQAWLDERHRLDLDRRDEMWDGVLHMVPPASSAHGGFGFQLAACLRQVAVESGLVGFVEPGVFDPAVQAMTSYRVADLGFAAPAHVTARGIEGRTALVVEILSPSDESYEKLSFYRHVGVEELLYVDPITRTFEVRQPAADDWAVVGPTAEGWVELTSLPAGLLTADGRLQVRTPGGLVVV